MEGLKMENLKLAQQIQECLEEIEKQKEINSQHENQIETLLNFNQRLLKIIQSEMNQQKKESCSLQPISERSERSSDLFGQCTIESLIRNKRLAVKSQWGGPTKHSLIERRLLKQSKRNLFQHASEIQSFKNDQNSQTALNESLSEPADKKASPQRTVFRIELQKGLQELRDFKDKTNIFYDQKLTEIKSLSTKLIKYQPLDELSKITSKIAISSQTLDLINNRLMKIV